MLDRVSLRCADRSLVIIIIIKALPCHLRQELVRFVTLTTEITLLQLHVVPLLFIALLLFNYILHSLQLHVVPYVMTRIVSTSLSLDYYYLFAAPCCTSMSSLDRVACSMIERTAIHFIHSNLIQCISIHFDSCHPFHFIHFIACHPFISRHLLLHSIH